MTLQEFLNKSKSVKKITKKVIVGDRFVDENGKDMPFEIKTFAANKHDKIRSEASKGEYFKASEYNTKIVVEGCVYPNFKNTESIKSRGLHTPEEFVRDVLLPGEIDILSLEIQKLCGYNVSINDLIEEAKN